MYMGGAVQRRGRVNMTTFKMLMVMLFMILLCTERWGDPRAWECDGRTLVVSHADGSSAGCESSTAKTHTLEDVDEGRRGRRKDREQDCYCVLTMCLQCTPQDNMSDTEENATSEAAMTMSTPKQETLLASSSVKTYKASAKSKRGNGSMRKFLEEDGELDAEDVMVVGKLLAKLGFFKKEDLRMLG